MTPRFVLAKYVPDLNRMEPRNIGVFLWARGKICARFLDAAQADFVRDKDTYLRWVDFWQKTVACDSIKPRRGKAIAKKDPSCIEALLSTQDGQYVLIDAGELLEAINTRELVRATDFLFGDLVTTKEIVRKETAKTLRQRCDEVFQSSGVADRKDFHRRYPIECPVYGSRRRFRFSYGIGNGNGLPQSLFQLASLSSEVSINNAAFTLHTVTESAIVEPERCAALIQQSDEDNEMAQEGREWLSRICEVIDMSAPSAADHLLQIVS